MHMSQNSQGSTQEYDRCNATMKTCGQDFAYMGANLPTAYIGVTPQLHKTDHTTHTIELLKRLNFANVNINLKYI